MIRDVPQSGSPANTDTSALKGAPGEGNIASTDSKGVFVKLATDKMKDARKSDDESKGIAADEEARDEPILKSKSDRRIEASGESRKERERDRDRDMDRDRTKSRERDRGRNSDKERDREEAERDKLKDHAHRSKERVKDSGYSEKTKRQPYRDGDYYGSSYPVREKDRHRHH